MPKMTAVEAAVRVLEKEGVTTAFGVPGAAINPLYAAMKRAEQHHAHPRAPRRRRLAHGRGLHARARPATSASASAPPGRPAPT